MAVAQPAGRGPGDNLEENHVGNSTGGTSECTNADNLENGNELQKAGGRVCVVCAGLRH